MYNKRQHEAHKDDVGKTMDVKLGMAVKINYRNVLRAQTLAEIFPVNSLTLRLEV